MSVDPALLQQAADALWHADQTRTPIAPVRELLGTATDTDVGYAVQEINARRSLELGRKVSGRKIGVTSKAVQQQIGVAEPDFGTLYVDTEYGDGVEIPASRLIQPRAEGEIALVVGRELDHAPHSFGQVMRAIEYALPSIEVVDSRIERWQISIVDTIADNASCGVYVLGSRPMPLSAFDIRTVPMAMSVNGSVVSEGTGAACLGNPLHAATWLADTLCQRGIPLQPGDVLMTGALGPMHDLATGDEIDLDFGPLGRVATKLADE